MKHRSYHDLSRLSTFEERFDYLNLRGQVGQATFGFDRWLNQYFYHSQQWKGVRYEVILRDDGCDLGIPGMEIGRDLLVHHMNPVTKYDIENGEEWILDPEYLICTTKITHNAIHFGDKDLLPRPVVEREPNDTSLW